MAKYNWNDTIIKECSVLYLAGKSYMDIAKHLGVSKNMVCGMANRNRKLFPSKPGTARKPSYVDKIDINKASELWNKGRTREEIATLMGVNINAIRLLSERNRDLFPKKQPGPTSTRKKYVRSKEPKAVTVSDKGRLHAQFNGSKQAIYFDPSLDEYETSRLPGLSFMENNGCFYPLTEGPHDHKFCGHDRLIGKRYCEYHVNKTSGFQAIDFGYRERYDRNVVRETII